MKTRRRFLTLMGTIATCLAVGLLVTSPLLAKKGGGGKPGGGGEDPEPDPDPAPTAPVSYYVTPITPPASSFRFADHNESTAIVGYAKNLNGSWRAMAYLPSMLVDQAYYLDDPILQIVGVDFDYLTTWETRAAYGINKHDDIVGNLISVELPETRSRRAFLLEFIPDGSPQLTMLGPCNPLAEREVARGINDSGDIVIWSEGSLFVGNPKLGVSFTEISYTGYAFNEDGLKITNRVEGSPAILTGHVSDGGTGANQKAFRLTLDGSPIEIAPIYTDASGNGHEFHSYNDVDINDSGDVTGSSITSAAKGKKSNTSATLWPYGLNELFSVGSDDSMVNEWYRAGLNNDGDFLLDGFGDGFGILHGEWGQANGAKKITDLIAADDPNRGLYGGYSGSNYPALEITNRGGTGWPTIIGSSSVTVDGADQQLLLILSPVPNQ